MRELMESIRRKLEESEPEAEERRRWSQQAEATKLLELARQICSKSLGGHYGDDIRALAQTVFQSTQVGQCTPRFIRDAVVQIQLTRRALRDGRKPPTKQQIEEKRRFRAQIEWQNRHEQYLDAEPDADWRYG